MHWSWVRTGSITEPVTLGDVKDHLHITDTAEDDFLTSLITVAREHVESFCNRSIPVQTIIARFDRFPYQGQCIRLPQSPVSSITSVQYVDTDGVTQTWPSSNYVLDDASEPARFDTAYNVTYPTTRNEINAVTITYSAGESSPPAAILHAIYLIIGDLYANREQSCPQQLYEIPVGVKNLLAGYRLYYRGPWL